MASNRFGTSSLHQRDPRSALFDSYTGDRNRTTSASPATRPGSGMQNGSANIGGYRSATPNAKGQYSDATLSSLEEQNDRELEGISGKVRMLKELTVAIGDEIKSSSSLADSMNDRFDNTRVRLRGTMNRMLRMAERTGVPWKYWLVFFAAVWGVFCWVWLF